ncbi:MAG: hypothetical protein HOY78_22915 [Saccharothrix sp.]|nr:hypothetical protein [Saccharothrix sp.]
MFVWLWHRLPGPRPARAVVLVLVVLALVAVLWHLVFPLLDQLTAGTVPILDQGRGGEP